MTKKVIKHKCAGGVVFFMRPPEELIALVKENDEWKLPKGHINNGETSEQAALREVQEELYLNKKHLFPASKINTTSYSFQTSQNSEMNYKTVDYYIFFTDKKELGNKIKWFLPAQAIKKLTFDNDKSVLKKALSLIKIYKPFYYCLEDIKSFLRKKLKNDLVAIILVGSLLRQIPIKEWTDIDIIIVVQEADFKTKLSVGTVLSQLNKNYKIKIGANIISKEELENPKYPALSLEGKTVQAVYDLNLGLNKILYGKLPQKIFHPTKAILREFCLKNIGTIKLASRKLVEKAPRISDDELKKEVQTNIRSCFIIIKLTLKYLKNIDATTYSNIIANTQKYFKDLDCNDLIEFIELRTQWTKINNKIKLLSILKKTDDIIEYISKFVFSQA